MQVSLQGSNTRGADGDRAVLTHKAGHEQRDAHQRFTRAYVDAQLAQQWAAGQGWAGLDARGVPWSQECMAAAEDRWLKVHIHITSSDQDQPKPMLEVPSQHSAPPDSSIKGQQVVCILRMGRCHDRC